MSKNVLRRKRDSAYRKKHVGFKKLNAMLKSKGRLMLVKLMSKMVIMITRWKMVQLLKSQPQALRRLPKLMMSMLTPTKPKRKSPNLSNLKRISKKIPEPRSLLLKAKRAPDLKEMTSVRKEAVVVVVVALPGKWFTERRLKSLSQSLTKLPLKMSPKVRKKMLHRLKPMPLLTRFLKLKTQTQTQRSMRPKVTLMLKP